MNHKELKRALKYCDAINKDLQSVKLKNPPKAIEIRNDIIPNAVEWLNTHLQTICLDIQDDKCYLA